MLTSWMPFLTLPLGEPLQCAGECHLRLLHGKRNKLFPKLTSEARQSLDANAGEVQISMPSESMTATILKGPKTMLQRALTAAALLGLTSLAHADDIDLTQLLGVQDDFRL